LVIASGVVAGPVVWQLSLSGREALGVDGDAIVTASGTRASIEWASPRPRLHFERSR
jgi:hypothetical protein